MDELLKELLEHYNDMIVLMAEKIEDAEAHADYFMKEKNKFREKNDAQAKEIEELSRTISVLRDTLKCHNDFLDNGELREDYEKFQDKWLANKEENNEQS